MDSGVCDLMSTCGEGLGNELFNVSGDDIQCQFCTKVSTSWQRRPFLGVLETLGTTFKP